MTTVKMSAPVKTLLRRIPQIHQNADTPPATDPMPSLRLSRFDAVSSFLSALMILLGTTVSMLFILWLLGEGAATQPEVHVERTRVSTSPIGFAMDFEPPGAEEIEDTLASIEKEYCETNGKSFPRDIAKTVFQSDATADGFSFQVVGQRYRSIGDQN
ncbi:hypothetical protein Enr13x_52150 [Stieleria neptunia]|uniref:Uncharacterized protein n=1 Tax=Stieleria neptunia TaxID=2527979 RepID=A0A518HWV4_9BACT|nr:hypothetical protein [Stieleria neptunia]QDV45339.1 hypothetical protein Enr13x_52150 [Stieleria neptunia]